MRNSIVRTVPRAPSRKAREGAHPQLIPVSITDNQNNLPRRSGPPATRPSKYRLDCYCQAMYIPPAGLVTSVHSTYLFLAFCARRVTARTISDVRCREERTEVPKHIFGGSNAEVSIARSFFDFSRPISQVCKRPWWAEEGCTCSRGRALPGCADHGRSAPENSRADTCMGMAVFKGLQ